MHGHMNVKISVGPDSALFRLVIPLLSSCKCVVKKSPVYINLVTL